MMRVAAFALLAALLPVRSAAQFPAELAGRVVEQGTSRPVTGALVEAGPSRTFSDASGAFLLRVADAGVVDLTISHPAYAELRLTRRLEAGRTVVELFVLEPAPVPIEGIAVVAERRTGFVLERADIERAGVQTLAELLRDVPGVLVRDAADGGARISIRGGSADQVLVLLDGVPVNDPVTGEADASAVSLQGVRTVQVLPGAQSARHGARAAAGVVLVETAGMREPFASAVIEAGSLGSLALQGEGAMRAGGATASAGARLRAIDGDFDYELPESLGGGSATRRNGDERETGGFASVALPLFGELRVRADLSRVDRGLPGPMYALTPRARQDVLRGDVRTTWEMAHPTATLRATASAGAQRLRFDDPAPAFGPAYHDTTRVRDAGLRVEAERDRGTRVARTLGAGAEVRRLELESTSLDPARVTRVDPSVFAHATLGLPARALAPRLALAVQAAPWDEEWIVSHDVALSATMRHVTASIAQRSAFSPPAASDQFFAAGFAIAPNPALEPERVRSEIELTISAAFEAGHMPLELGGSAYLADVEGLIVWAPDFRFVWSPRNRDVKRSGGEAWLRARPVQDVALGAWAAIARVTYDWDGDADTVQVVYRPRHSAGATVEWTPGSWTLSLGGAYTGLRYATPGHANPLPGYWDVRLAAGRSFRRGPLDFDAALRVDRLLDNTDSFVHGYAEPGRRISMEMRMRAAEDEADITLTRTGS